MGSVCPIQCNNIWNPRMGTHVKFIDGDVWSGGFVECFRQYFPVNKVHGANMGPIWGRQDPDGPHVGPMNLAIRDGSDSVLLVIIRLHWLLLGVFLRYISAHSSGLLFWGIGSYTTNRLNFAFEFFQQRDEDSSVFVDFLAFETQGGWSSYGCTETAFVDAHTLCS